MNISPNYQKTFETCLSSLPQLSTPCYVYNYEQLRDNLDIFKNLTMRYKLNVHYAVKSNNNKTILKIINETGLGFDVNSGGELEKVLSIGVSPEKITFAGVGKTDDEIRLGIKNRVGLIKVESYDEIKVISTIATELQLKANIGLRLNPNIDAKTHPYISTGLSTSKFGIDIRELNDVLDAIKKNDFLELVGLDAHIGSQISDLGLYLEVFQFLKSTADQLNEDGFKISDIDLGGGFGIAYDGSGQSTIKLLDQLFSKLHQQNQGKYKILIEPGRSIIANTCIILSKVLYVKTNGEKKFAVIDASMTENIRPALYEAVHPIVNLTPPNDSDETEIYDVVGPVCETGDYLAQNIEIQKVKRGDYIAILDSGAYTSVMASNYNMRPFSAEYLVRHNQIEMIRKPQTLLDLVKGLDD